MTDLGKVYLEFITSKRQFNSATTDQQNQKPG